MAQNTEQIIKALEWAVSKEFCENCLCTVYGKSMTIFLKDALALIKELQAHNENLKRENKYLRESLADEREHKEDMEGVNNDPE